MHEVLVYSFGDLSLPRKNVVRLTDRPDMTLDVYRGRRTTIQQQQQGGGGELGDLISHHTGSVDDKIEYETSYSREICCFAAIGDLDDFGNLPSISEKDIEKLRKTVEKTKGGHG